MLNERGLRTILVILGVSIVGLLMLALYQWFGGDKTASLALTGVMATFALAFAAVLTLEQNRSLVKAAADQATASRDAVDQDRALLKASSDQAAASWQTVEEMKHERELAYKPLLVVTQGPYDPQGTSRTHLGLSIGAFIIRNIGTGPALNVAFCAQGFDGEPATLKWVSAQFPGMAVGTEERVPKFFGHEPSPGGIRPDRYRCLVEDWQWGDDGLVFAVRYEDWFGTHYLSPGGPQSHKPAEWRGAIGVVDQPNWMRCS